MNNESFQPNISEAEVTVSRIEQLTGKYDAKSMDQKCMMLPPAIITELDQKLNQLGMSLDEVHDHASEWFSDIETNRILSSYISTIYMHLASPKIISETLVAMAAELKTASEK